MISLKTIKKSNSNYWYRNKMIPLGVNTWQGNIEQPIVSIPLFNYGSTVLVSDSRWGKTFTAKRIFEYQFMDDRRAGLILDMQGVDHRESVRAANPKVLFKGEHPIGFGKKIKIFTPTFVKDQAFSKDQIFGLSLLDFERDDWMSLGMQESSARLLYKIIKHFPEQAEDPKEFFQEFEKLPKSSKEKNKSKIKTETIGIDFIIPAQKNHIETFLEMLIGDEKHNPVVVKHGSKEHLNSFEKYYDNGQIVLINFFDERIYSPLYAGFLLKQVYWYARKKNKENKNFNAPFVFIEEANLFTDNNDPFKRKGSNYYLVELLCRGFKFGLAVMATFQSLIRAHQEVKDFISSGSFPILLGNLNPSDKEFFKAVFEGLEHMNIRKRVPNKDWWGGKEWAVYINKWEYGSCVMYPCMSGTHSGIGSGG